MNKHLKLFTNHSAYSQAESSLDKPNVSHCIQENEVHYNPDPFNGHAYVDLGLPSGTLWAKCNVGANSETSNGLYFAWGETQGYTAAQCAEVDEDSVPINYRFYSQDGMTKYNTTDNLTHLELTDDAAAVNMGGEWHMPNGAQCLELLKETTIGYITDEGAYTQCVWDDLNFRVKSTLTIATVNGWNTAGFLFFKNGVTDINTAVSSGEYVFIPAAGYEGYEESGNSGYIWTSFRNLDNINSALAFAFSAGNFGINGFPPFYQDGERFIHQSIRGVVGQMDEIEDIPR